MIGEFEYARVSSVEEGCALLSKHNGKAKVLAGGTDLLVSVRNETASPVLLVDFKGIEKLARFQPDGTGGAFIGASVPLTVLAENETLRQKYRALAEAAASIGTCQIRNRATLVGNLCNASPAADTAPALLVLDAVAQVSNPRGSRALPIRDLFVGVKQNALQVDEVVTAVCLPSPVARVRTKFLKKQRIRGHDLAIINMAGIFNPETGELRVAIGSCAKTPILLPALDERVSEKTPAEELAAHLIELAQRAISPISDLRGSARYRRALVPVFLRRLLAALLHPAEVSAREGNPK